MNKYLNLINAPVGKYTYILPEHFCETYQDEIIFENEKNTQAFGLIYRRFQCKCFHERIFHFSFKCILLLPFYPVPKDDNVHPS